MHVQLQMRTYPRAGPQAQRNPRGGAPTWQEGVGPQHLVGIILVPVPQRQRAQPAAVGKLRRGGTAGNDRVDGQPLGGQRERWQTAEGCPGRTLGKQSLAINAEPASRLATKCRSSCLHALLVNTTCRQQQPRAQSTYLQVGDVPVKQLARLGRCLRVADTCLCQQAALVRVPQRL